MEYFNLFINNIDKILGGVVLFATILNQIMPKKITNAKLAKLEAITSMISVGNKKSEVIKK